MGKSLGFIKIQEHLGPKLTYLIVSEQAHIENWEAEYRKFGKEYLLKNTIIMCYASLRNIQHTSADLIGLDEAHHCSTLRLQYLATVKVPKIIAMSATLSNDIKKALTRTFGEFKESVISLRDAVREK